MFLPCLMLLLACGESSTSTDAAAGGRGGPATGGQSGGGSRATGGVGASSGGASTGGQGGSRSGGTGTGGAAGLRTGGASTGGSATGGSTGGVRTGGSATGGSTGGAAGARTGGSNTGGSTGGAAGARTGGSNTGGATGGSNTGGASPSTSCSVPDEGKPADVSAPTTVVGDGSSASCTAAALDAAVQKAGVITFNCGSSPVTITLTKQIRINNQGGASKLGDTVIDGGGKVTLSGGKASRILYLNACEPPYNSDHCDTFDHPRLTVQNLDFIDGKAPENTRAGAAIYANGGWLKVVNARFKGHRCVTAAPDVAGGAIATYLQGGRPVYLVNSTFEDNQCASGGAIGSIGVSYFIYNSRFTGNVATGHAPDQGGNGGSIANDGAQYELRLCGTTVTASKANANGGGIFQVSNEGIGTTTVESSSITDNASTEEKHSGGLYIQGTAATFRRSTIARNSADFAAGLYVHPSKAGNSLAFENVTVADNVGAGVEVENSIVGTLLNATIAGNTRGLAGGTALKLTNTIIARNTSSQCSASHPSGGGNVQFPTGGTSCTSDVTFGDPKLGALGDNGGATSTMLPGEGSAAIGLGKSCPSVDQRSKPRSAATCASGAVEPP